MKRKIKLGLGIFILLISAYSAQAQYLEENTTLEPSSQNVTYIMGNSFTFSSDVVVMNDTVELELVNYTFLPTPSTAHVNLTLYDKTADLVTFNVTHQNFTGITTNVTFKVIGASHISQADSAIKVYYNGVLQHSDLEDNTLNYTLVNSEAILRLERTDDVTTADGAEGDATPGGGSSGEDWDPSTMGQYTNDTVEDYSEYLASLEEGEGELSWWDKLWAKFYNGVINRGESPMLPALSAVQVALPFEFDIIKVVLMFFVIVVLYVGFKLGIIQRIVMWLMQAIQWLLMVIYMIIGPYGIAIIIILLMFFGLMYLAVKGAA